MKHFGVITCLFAVVASSLPAAQAEDRQELLKALQQLDRQSGYELFDKLLNVESKAIVTIKYVMTYTYEGESGKFDNEGIGTVVSPDGMILCSATMLQGYGENRVQTSDYKVIIGNDNDNELSAKLIARDSDLDLAWLKITDPIKDTLHYVDFENSITLRPGDVVFMTPRMSRRFDRAPFCHYGLITGSIEVPRPLLIVNAYPGIVVFDQDGKVGGFTIAQPPDETEVDEDGFGVFLLSGSKVAESLKKMQKLADSDKEEESESN